jgi:hypothetical protein
MPYTIKFKLKQHTPLLHFQYNEAKNGASIRPSEVKPKLDNFIWQNEWSNQYSKGKTYLVGYSPSKSNDLESQFTDKDKRFRALDYKIWFEAHDNTTSQLPERQLLYFGNMGDEKQEKHFVMATGGITGTITSSDPGLLDIVKKNLAAFFQMENFGTRQNKGFGSFQVVDLDGIAPVNPAKPSKYSFKIKNSSQEALWLYIDLFYRSLRSGINLKGRGGSDKLYFKSLMFQYAKSLGNQWDKRKIKQDLFRKEIELQRDDNTGTVKYDKGTPLLYRDMLGLSSSQSWLSYKATVNKTSKEIDRFKSPITFKPFKKDGGWEVFIIAHSVPKDMMDQSFEIEASGKPTKMSTPSDFDVNAFLEYAFAYFDEDATIEDYVGEHFAQHEVQILTEIYDQLKPRNQ